jgi:hypothetical protein
VGTTGIFALSSPRDLFEKLRHDLDELKAQPDNTYLAFNFVVTAEHMLDWLHPGSANRKIRERLRTDPLLALISHLANGAKHFDFLSPHHQSVRGTEKVSAPITVSATRGSRSILPPHSRLIVHLDGQAKQKFGPYIEVVDLATKTYAHWSGSFP